MKIAFNIDYFFNRNTGIGRYGVELMKAFIESGQECEVWMTRFMAKFDSISQEVDDRRVFYPWPRRITDYFWPGKRARKKDIDWVHSANCMLLPSSGSFHQTCMIHDMGPFMYGEMKPAAETRMWNERIKRVVKVADTILVNSPSTGRDLIEFFPEAEGRTFVTPLGIDHFPAHPMPSANREHILSIGTVEPRKNIDGLLRGYDILRKTISAPRLVIAGMDGYRAAEYKELAHSLGLSGLVEFTGFISDKKLIELFSKSLCLVHPAHHEGFGFTIPEAFQWDLPVAASLAGGAGDFFGDCVWNVNPNSAESIAEGMALALEKGMTTEQKTARRAISSKLTWRNCASATLRALEGHYSVQK